jgi:hypothetical protein
MLFANVNALGANRLLAVQGKLVSVWISAASPLIPIRPATHAPSSSSDSMDPNITPAL